MSNKVERLTGRWKHPENESVVIQSDKLGRGDISGWAKAVSKPFGSPSRPIRPEVGEVKREFHPIHDLRNCHMRQNAPRLHDPSIVCMPADPKTDPRSDMGRAAIIAEVNHKLHEFSVSRILKSGKVLEMPKPVDLLADCPKSDVSALIMNLKEREFPRDEKTDKFRPDQDPQASFGMPKIL